MKKILIKICLAVLVAVIGWGVVIAFNPEPKTIGELMEDYENPGLKIKIRSPFSGTVLVAKKGKIIFHEAYGEANRATKTPNTIDTKFGIGSVTKQFTAMLVMQLVEKDQIKLEDTLNRYLPYLPSDKADHITIHQLLSHTSGLPHYNGLQSIGMTLKEFGNTQYTPISLAHLIGKTRLIHVPGTAYSYSSLGYDLLGTILEEVTGITYAELLDINIVKPLGLRNTGFGSNEYVAKELAKGYRYKELYGLDWWSAENGGETTEALFRDQSTTFATGGIHSTVHDLYIWSKAMKTNKLLSPEMTKIMLQPNKNGYCYGWFRNWDDLIEKNVNVRLYGHGGALAGNSAFIAIFDDETTIIYLSNRSNLKAEEIIHQIHLRANNLKDTYKLQGYPDRSSYKSFEAAGGMPVLQDYFNRLSTYSGYIVHPSRHTMSGVMKIYLEAGKLRVADSLKTVFLTKQNPDESTLNQMGYQFLDSDHPTYALDFFKENTKKYPYSSNAWDSLGEAYLNYNEFKKSVECYSKAVEIGEKVGHGSLDIYKANLKNAKEKLIEQS